MDQDNTNDPILEPQEIETEILEADDIPELPSEENIEPVQPVGSSDKPAPLSVVSDEELLALKKEIEELHPKKEALAKKLASERASVVELEQTAQSVAEREDEIRSVLDRVTTNEHGATDPHERQKNERERWQHVEEWYAIEQEKWQSQDHLLETRRIIDVHQRELAALNMREMQLKGEIEEAGIEKDKERAEADLDVIVMERIKAEKKLKIAKEEEEKVAQKYDELREKEEDIEKKGEDVDSQLAAAKSLLEERGLAQKRYLLEKERHEIESSRWKAEEEMERTEGSVGESQKIVEDLRSKESNLWKKIEELKEEEKTLEKKRKSVSTPDIPLP